MRTIVSKIKKVWDSGTVKTLGIFAGGNLLVSIIGGVGSLLQARWVAPEVFGEFQKYSILTGYFAIGTIFVQDGFARQFPYLLGKKEREKALEIASTAKWWYLFLVLIYSLFFGGLTFWSALCGNWRAVFGWGAQVTAVWTGVYGAYQGVLYRTSSEFRRLSYNNLIGSVLGFLALALVKILGYWGVALRFMWNSVVNVVVNHHYLPVKVKATFNKAGLVALAKMSLPLAGPGYIQTSFLSASVAALILKRFGQESLGYYGVAIMFQGFAMTLTNALHQIFSVRMVTRYGETHDAWGCIRYGFQAALISFILSLGIAVLFCIGTPFLIHFLMPKYVSATGMVSILVFVLPLAALALPLQMLKIQLFYSSFLMVSLIKAVAIFGTAFFFAHTLNQFALCVIGGETLFLLAGYALLFLNNTPRTRQKKNE